MCPCVCVSVCVCLCVCVHSDDTRTTTWLHPRSGEPVNSGHMIRSGTDRLRLTSCSPGGRGLRRALVTTRFWFCFRPPVWMGGRLHGRGRQFLHQVSEESAAATDSLLDNTSTRRRPLLSDCGTAHKPLPLHVTTWADRISVDLGRSYPDR